MPRPVALVALLALAGCAVPAADAPTAGAAARPAARPVVGGAAARAAADAPAGPTHSSSAYPHDDAMGRCLHAVATVPHLPLRRYRVSCAPRLVQGSSAGHASLVGGNTHRDSADVVVATYLSDAAFVRVVQHETAHAYVLENPPVQRALTRWAGVPDVLDDPTPYPRQAFEVFAAAWARCHGGGPDPVVEDARMTCTDAARIVAAR